MDLDYDKLAIAQTNDCENQRYLKNLGGLRQLDVPESQSKLWCDISTGKPRPFLPPAFRRSAYERLHGLSHPGIKATKKLVAERFVSPKMNSHVVAWARSCIECQRAKITRHVSSPLASFMLPDSRFDTVHVDIVGPLTVSRGQRYLLTCVDRFTRWPEVIPIHDICADTVAKAFLIGWVARFGVPSAVISDRGRQFESELWSDLCKLLGIKKCRTTAYHPQSNGMMERLHRQLKASLRAHDAYPDWMAVLPAVLLGIRLAIKDDLNCTSSELVYGTTLRLPGEDCAPMSTPTTGDIASYATQLRTAMSALAPTAPRQKKSKNNFCSCRVD